MSVWLSEAEDVARALIEATDLDDRVDWRPGRIDDDRGARLALPPPDGRGDLPPAPARGPRMPFDELSGDGR